MSTTKRKRATFARRRPERQSNEVELREQTLVEELIKVVAGEGFKFAPMRAARGVDFAFKAADGALIGVECRSFPIEIFQVPDGYLDNVVEKGKFNEVLFVAPSFSPRAREALESHPKAETVETAFFQEFIQQYKDPSATPSSAPAPRRLRGTRSEILAACAGLAALIDDKLAELRGQKPNSDTAIATRNAAIDDYEKLKAQVTKLQKVVDAYTGNKIPGKEIEKQAKTFGKTVDDWWKKQGSVVLTTSSGIALLSLSALLAGMVGVNPHLAYLIAGGLFGGPKLIESAAKGVRKL